MKLALIPPYSRLKDMMHTNYQLALAHILAEPSGDGVEYAGAFLDAQAQGDYIILDNGAYEGSLVSPATLVDVANNLRPNEIVIPDNMGNDLMTRDLAANFYHNYYDQLDHLTKLMFVAQGTNREEMGESITWAIEQDWINTIAIPKHTIATCQDKHARIDFAEFINKYSPKDIHLLGASPLWTDEIRAARDSGIIRGMDTSMPYVYGLSYEHWPSESIIDSKDSRDFYFHIEADSEQDQIITANVKGMIDVVREI